MNMLFVTVRANALIEAGRNNEFITAFVHPKLNHQKAAVARDNVCTILGYTTAWTACGKYAHLRKAVIRAVFE